MNETDAKDWIFDNIDDYVPPVAAFGSYIFPVIEKMGIIDSIDELLSVQAMTHPVAKLFPLDFIHR